MEQTSRDLGEVQNTPELSNASAPTSTENGLLSINSFNIFNSSSDSKSEDVSEVIKKEKKDSGIV